LLERIGNVSGPIVVGSVLVLFQQSASALSVLGVAFVALLALFATIARSPAPAPVAPALQPAG
jgi:hypothetical protein